MAISPIGMRRIGFTNMLVGVLHVCVALQLYLGERPVESAIQTLKLRAVLVGRDIFTRVGLVVGLVVVFLGEVLFLSVSETHLNSNMIVL